MSSVALPRPAERVAILSLVLVFLCGAVSGALVMGWGEHTGFVHGHSHRTALDIQSERWIRELNLTSTQTKEVNSVLEDFGRYYDNLMADGQTRIRQILNPEQRRRFDEMIKDNAVR